MEGQRWHFSTCTVSTKIRVRTSARAIPLCLGVPATASRQDGRLPLPNTQAGNTTPRNEHRRHDRRCPPCLAPTTPPDRTARLATEPRRLHPGPVLSIFATTWSKSGERGKAGRRDARDGRPFVGFSERARRAALSPLGGERAPVSIRGRRPRGRLDGLPLRDGSFCRAPTYTLTSVSPFERIEPLRRSFRSCSRSATCRQPPHRILAASVKS